MDYCIPCRRTLNGAVTCPECGAYDHGMAPLSDGGGDAPAVDTAAMEVLFDQGPDSAKPRRGPSLVTPQVPATDLPEARRHGPPRWKRYGVRTLAAATFAVLGGLATASLVPQHSAGLPQAAPSPEPASPDEPQGHDTSRPPNASRSPDRPATHPGRGAARKRNDGVTRRPDATPTDRESPAPQASAAPVSSPPVKAVPTPSPSSGRPSQPPLPPTTPTPSPSTSAGASASPTGSPAPVTTGDPGTDVLSELA
ncbi:SCO2400 family protein [Streptomyces sp. NPDC054841]